MLSVIFKHNNFKKSFIVNEGFTVLEVARKFNIKIEGSCEGSLACSTCHIVVEKSFFDTLPEPSEEEEDMLDLAVGLQKTSRLGCQIEVSEELDGLRVLIPSSFNLLIKLLDILDTCLEEVPLAIII